MTRPKVHYLAKGMMQLESGNAQIRTVVGSGFAVVVFHPQQAWGGMVHVPHRPAARLSPRTEPSQAMRGLVNKFLQRLTARGHSLAQGVAEIAGGADLLRLTPFRLRQQGTRVRTAALADVLAERGIETRRIHDAGVKSQLVVLDLDRGLVRVTEAASAKPSEQFSDENVTFPMVGHRNLPAVTTVEIGCLEVSQRPGRLSALLGSCVGLALYDPTTGTGGLAHVMMPRCPNGDPKKAKYADTATEALIGAMILAGANRRYLEAKLAGGSRTMFSGDHSRIGNVGEANIDQIKADLEQRRIPIVGEDLGGATGRKMTVDLEDFRVRVKLLHRAVVRG